MKKSFKKVLVSLLCLAMLATMIPFTSLAADAEETEITIGIG